MTYRFIILSDEKDDFRRDILIDSDATFFELHNAILDSVGFTKDQMTSFFLCDEDWMKGTEITIIEMDTRSDVDSYVMDTTRLSDLIEDEKQRLIYVFETLTERAFFIELREIITGKKQEKPECIKSVGNPPQQNTDFNELDSKTSAIISEDENFFDDEDANFDEYDDEDFGNLNEGNPFADY
jgi:predicted metalloprotease with PDZ domain